MSPWPAPTRRCMSKNGRRKTRRSNRNSLWAGSTRPSFGWAARRPAMERGLLGHGFLEILINLVEEAFGREPLLIGADEKCEVLGHEALLHRVDTDLFHGRGELGQPVVVVQLGAMRQPARPGEDRGDGIGRSGFALL